MKLTIRPDRMDTHLNVPPVTDDTLIALLENNVSRFGDKPAVQAVDTTLSYRAFYSRVLLLAIKLEESGCQPKSHIGIMMDRSMEMVVGIFGILKHGCSYVPTDPSYPDGRIKSLYSDAQVNYIVTTAALKDRVESLGFIAIVVSKESPLVDSVESILKSYTHVDVLADDTAYVLFTSGSTGTPKGVEIAHHSVVNLVQYIQDRYPITGTDKVLFKSPYTFDGSVWELFGWLLPNATLFIAPPGAEKDPGELIRIIEKYNISFAFFVPSMLQAFLDFAKISKASERLKSMKWVSVGGEVLPVPLVSLFYQVFNSQYVGLFNVYGPTETTVYATTFLCKGDESYDKIPIGESVTGDYIYILDANMQPVADGAEGEIFIGGRGVGKGYLNRPELTAERFLNDPFNPGGLMYRTGDLGRKIGDDLYDFIGRLDFQVKLRGQRIELGEVEHAIRSHPFIKECCVLYSSDRNGDPALIAYLIQNPIETVEQDQLVIEFLGRIESLLLNKSQWTVLTADIKDLLNTILNRDLPQYMLPAEFVLGDEFPLSHHGKIDRKALPAIRQLITQEIPVDAFMPKDADEEQLYVIWKEELGREHIRQDESFFDAGGHSLKAVRVITKVMDLYGVEIPVKWFYDELTLPLFCSEVKKLIQSVVAQLPPLISEPSRKRYPLSPAMRELWFVNMLDESGITRNIQIEFVINGEPDRHKVEQVLNTMISTEPLFRSVFPLDGDEPSQFIREVGVLLFEEVDLSHLSHDSLDLEYKKVNTLNGRYKFDLSKLPLLKFLLVKVGERDYRLLMTIHHLIFDGWSLEVFMRRFSSLYLGLTQNLPESHVGDYAVWLRRVENKSVGLSEASFWRRNLRGIPDMITLPWRDAQRPRDNKGDGDRYWWSIPRVLSKEIDRVANQLHTTPFSVMTSAFQLILAAHSGQRDIVVGTPYANRNHPGIKEVIGLFTNIVALRLLVEEHDTFIDIIHKVRRASSDAFSNTGLIFSDVVREVNQRKIKGVNPIFQTSIVMQNWPGTAIDTGDFTMWQREIGNSTSKLDLMLNIEKRDGEYVCWFEYNTALFDLSYIHKLAGDFIRVNDSITTNPNDKVSSVLASLERQWLDRRGALGLMTSTKDPSLPELLDRIVVEFSEKIAIKDHERTLTYGQLSELVTSIAKRLKDYHIKQGDRVAIFMNKTPELIATMVSIAKIGAIYIPVDPLYPEGRLSMIFEDGMPVLVITNLNLKDKLPGGQMLIQTIEELVSDEKRDSIIQKSKTIDRLRAVFSKSKEVISLKRDETEGYIIFTSGSTGRPKGVHISQSALVNFLLSMKDEPGFSSADSILGLTTVSFDISGLEIWLPLVTGGSMILVSSEEAANPELLTGIIHRDKPTVIQATPSTWRLLLETGWKGAQGVKILCGGEAMTGSLAGELLPRCASLWNMYGPTETTIWSAIKRVTQFDADNYPIIPIGRAIRNTVLCVLNDDGRPVTGAHSGELYIGGAGLAEGYFRQAQMTSDRFIVDPYGRSKNDLLYKTGDLVRWDDRGELLFLERKDNQIKLRGYRIEAGEIENAISELGHIDEAMVILFEGNDGVKQLVAAVAAKEDSFTGEEPIKTILRRNLPAYMIPSRIIRLDSLPLTPNGKRDKKELISICSKLLQDSDNRETISQVGNMTATELELTRIWSRVLKISQPSIEEDFFDLGGNSLVAVRLMIEIEKATGVRLPLSVLFNHGTIKEMGKLLDEKDETRNKQEWLSLVPIKTTGNKKPLFLIHAAGLNLLLYNTLINHLDKNQPVYGLQAVGLDGKHKALDKLEEIAATYIKEVLLIDKEGPYALAGFCMGGTIAWEMSRQLKAMGKEVAFIGLFETIAYRLPDVMPSGFVQLTNDLSWSIRQLSWNTLQIFRLSGERRKEFLNLKWKRIQRRVKGVPEIALQETVVENIDNLLPASTREVRLANEIALANYIIRPDDLKVCLFKAKEQTFYISDNVNYGWRDLALAGTEVITVDGTHSTIFSQPHGASFAQKLQEILDRSFDNVPVIHKEVNELSSEHSLRSIFRWSAEGEVNLSEKNLPDQKPVKIDWYGNDKAQAYWWFSQLLIGGFNVSEQTLLENQLAEIIESEGAPSLLFVEMGVALPFELMSVFVNPIENNKLIDTSFSECGKGIVVAKWVELKLNLEGVDFQTQYAPFRKTRNAVKQIGYRPVWSSDIDDLKFFYKEIYLPFIAERQGEHLILTQYEEFEHIIAGGGLLLQLMVGNSVVAGAVIDNQAMPMLHSVGVDIIGHRDLLGKEVVRSLYYFSALRLQQDGHKAMNLGGCRPLAKDTTLWFKKSLGGEIMPIRNFQGMGVAIKVGAINPKIKAWFDNNSLYGEGPNGSCLGIRFSEDGDFVNGVVGEIDLKY